MLYPDTDLKTWSDMYKIQPLLKECPCCQQEFLTSVPFAIKGYRGLQTPTHECGDDGVVSILIPVDENSKAQWETLLFG